MHVYSPGVAAGSVVWPIAAAATAVLMLLSAAAGIIGNLLINN